MNPSDFPHVESELSEQLGVARGDVRVIRSEQLEQGRDWAHIRGAVRYTATGWSRLLGILKISLPAEPPPSLPAPPPEDLAPKNLGGQPPAPASPLEPGALRLLVIVRGFRNPRIVSARLDDLPARVRVRDSINLMPGMTMKCRFIREDLWDLAQPLPRRRGKW